ncbi:MAG: SBBP repeat-containing protein, partial [Deltaproteobacteria bacterium]|nr:SBBP repeat-containing protein [Deltaproteobacteria bacterium]
MRETALSWCRPVLLAALAVAGCRAIMGLDELAVGEQPQDGAGAGAAAGSGGTGGVSQGGGGAAACVPEQCPGLDTDCRERACVEGKCGVANAAPDTACKGVGDEQWCDGQGECVQCNHGSQCDSQICDKSKCVPAPCQNGQKDGEESDVDCGGADCAPCLDGKKCSKAADCASGFCDAGKCTAKKAKGDGCDDAAQCLSGNCADDVCCDKPCAGPCEACAKKLGASKNGTCTPLPEDTECRAPAGDCDLTENCDGQSGECPADELAKDGDPGMGDACDPYLCDGKDASCPQSCAADPDCTEGYYCYGASCTKKPGGEPCAVASECLSGNCADGVCCETPCAGLCRACSLAKTGAKNGICGPVSPGTDPDQECKPGVCAGPGACAVGSHLWSKRFGDTSDQDGNSVAVDGAGNALVTGYFWNTVDFGGGLLASAGSYDIFVAKFDPQGKHLWSKRFGEADHQYVNYIAADSSGNVLVTGYFAGTVDFGGGPLKSAGGHDIFVAKFDPQGNHLWSKRFGDASAQSGLGITADGAGNALVTGPFEGTVDFGGGVLASAGARDIFVAKFDPQGNHLW